MATAAAQAALLGASASKGEGNSEREALLQAQLADTQSMLQNTLEEAQAAAKGIPFYLFCTR